MIPHACLCNTEQFGPERDAIVRIEKSGKTNLIGTK